MTDETRDAGLIQVLAARMEKIRLPMAMSLKEKVDRGETLNDFDIRFLEEVSQDSQEIRGLLERHPEWNELASKILHLYKEITDKAVENAKKAQPG